MLNYDVAPKILYSLNRRIVTKDKSWRNKVCHDIQSESDVCKGFNCRDCLFNTVRNNNTINLLTDEFGTELFLLMGKLQDKLGFDEKYFDYKQNMYRPKYQELTEYSIINSHRKFRDKVTQAISIIRAKRNDVFDVLCSDKKHPPECIKYCSKSFHKDETGKTILEPCINECPLFSAPLKELAQHVSEHPFLMKTMGILDIKYIEE